MKYPRKLSQDTALNEALQSTLEEIPKEACLNGALEKTIEEIPGE